MRLRFARSAARYGISFARAAYVVEHCGLTFDASEEDSDLVLYVGDDQGGVPLEVVVVVGRGEQDGLVIHAMRLRRTYQDQYWEARPWRH